MSLLKAAGIAGLTILLFNSILNTQHLSVCLCLFFRKVTNEYTLLSLRSAPIVNKVFNLKKSILKSKGVGCLKDGKKDMIYQVKIKAVFSE